MLTDYCADIQFDNVTTISKVNSGKEESSWHMNFSGIDFLLSKGENGVRDVTTLDFYPECKICQHKVHDLNGMLSRCSELKDFYSARCLLQSVVPELNDIDLIAIHFKHSAPPEDRVLNMAMDLMERHYQIAMASSSGVAHRVVTDDGEFLIANPRNVSLCRDSTACFERLYKLIKGMRKTV